MFILGSYHCPFIKLSILNGERGSSFDVYLSVTVADGRGNAVDWIDQNLSTGAGLLSGKSHVDLFKLFTTYGELGQGKFSTCVPYVYTEKF